MATLRPNSASGQLSDPDSGCFSSHSNEAPGGWLEPHFGPASVAANGGIIGGGGVPIPMLIDSSSSPLSSSSSMSHHQPQQIPNNKLLAHTLENRKRVLHTLIREKTDTLVWCCVLLSNCFEEELTTKLMDIILLNTTSARNLCITMMISKAAVPIK